MSKRGDVAATVLALCNNRWQKVAMVIAKAGEQQGVRLRSSLLWGPLGTKDHDPECELYIAAIKSLVREGKLVLQGDASEPRFSEVRVAPT